MRPQILRFGLSALVVFALSLSMAFARKETCSVFEAPTRLPERHPAVLSGRMDRKQSTYVDLYAPLTPAEANQLSAYRTGTCK